MGGSGSLRRFDGGVFRRHLQPQGRRSSGSPRSAGAGLLETVPGGMPWQAPIHFPDVLLDQGRRCHASPTDSVLPSASPASPPLGPTPLTAATTAAPS